MSDEQMSDEGVHHVTLSLARGFEFVASFDDLPDSPPVLLDEPAPLGDGRGPSAAALLSAAVGNCLAASLLFCLGKARASVDELTARVTTHLVRNDAGRYRIGRIDVALTAAVGEDDHNRLTRCQDLFEDFCIVTESVRKGIPVNVTVRDGSATQPAAVSAP